MSRFEKIRLISSDEQRNRPGPVKHNQAHKPVHRQTFIEADHYSKVGQYLIFGSDRRGRLS
jgi:hypothetical protein